MSLMFYNLHGLTLRTLTLGNFGYLRTNLTKRKSERCRLTIRATPSRSIAGWRRVAL